MKSLPPYIVKIDQSGRATGPAAERLRGDLRRAFAGQFVRIDISGWVNLPENGVVGYYRAVVIPEILSGLRDLGNNVDPNSQHQRDKCHEMLKSMFLLGEKVMDGTGKEQILPPSTKKMSEAEWADYLRDIEIWASENLGKTIPPPSKQKKPAK